MAGQKIFYRTQLGQISFFSRVKYILPTGEEEFSLMPCWDQDLSEGWTLSEIDRYIDDGLFKYHFEAVPLSSGYKIRLSIKNIQTRPVRIIHLSPLSFDEQNGGCLLLGGNPNISWLRCLGYQSNSPAIPMPVDSRQPRNRIALNRIMDDNYYPDCGPEAGYYVLDWQGVISNNQESFVFSAITSKQRVCQGLARTKNGLLKSLRLASLCEGQSLDPDEELSSEWIYICFTDRPELALTEATEIWGRNMGARNKEKVLCGWAPQMRYKNRINEQQMMANLQYLMDCGHKLPVDFFTVDDGCQLAVGDWLEFSGRIGNVDKIFQKIKKEGYVPSIWMAPFVCQSDSKLMHEHPEWLLRDEYGSPRIAGGSNSWRGNYYALDCTNPAFLAQLKEWFSTLYQWGGRFFKVDCCYAAALSGSRFNPNITGLAALRDALAIIREAIGEDSYLNLGEVPFGAAIGFADAMRVGPKVDRVWQSQLQLLSTGSCSFPSAQNSIQGTLNRWYLHRRLAHNVPSWAISEHVAGNRLTKAQLRSLYTSIAISGGMTAISENLLEIGDECKEFQRLFPAHQYLPEAVLINEELVPPVMTVRTPDNERMAISFFNWENTIQTKTIGWDEINCDVDSSYHLYDPWENCYYGIWSENDLYAYNIPAFGCQVFIATKIHEDEPQLIGVHPMIMSSLLPGISSEYCREKKQLIIKFNGFSERKLSFWCYFPQWVENQPDIEVVNGNLNSAEIHEQAIEYQINCTGENVVITIKC